MEASREFSPMDEIYEPKKGFEDLFVDLLAEYKREIEAVSDAIARQDQLSNEKLEAWVYRKIDDAATKV